VEEWATMDEESPLVPPAGVELKRGASPVGNENVSVEYRIQVGISKVLDADEIFTADYELYLRFDAPPELKLPEGPWFDGAENFQLESLPSDSTPMPTFHGTESVDLLEQQCKLDRRQGKIYMFCNWLITFRETFALHRFPFDSQLFTMKIELGCMNTRAIVPVSWDSALEIPEAVYLPPELKGEDDVAVYYGGDSWYLKDIKLDLEQDDDGSIKLSVLAERKPGFYMWNILLLNFFLVMVNSAVAGIHKEDLADRLSVTLTLMLSAIAFKFVLIQTIPVVSYLTLLDRYVILSFSWLFVSCLESYMAATFLTQQMDDCFNAISASLWLTLHLIIVVGTLCGWFRVTDITQIVNERSRLMQELALSTQIKSALGMSSRTRTYSALARYEPDSEGTKF